MVRAAHTQPTAFRQFFPQASRCRVKPVTQRQHPACPAGECHARPHRGQGPQPHPHIHVGRDQRAADGKRLGKTPGISEEPGQVGTCQQPPHRVARGCLGLLQDPPRVRQAARPVEHHPGPLPDEQLMGGPVRLGASQPVQHAARRVELPQLAERGTKQQPGLERGRQLPRRTSQPRGEREVEHLAGLVRGPQQQPGVYRAGRLHPPGSQPQHVAPAAAAGRLQCIGQQPLQAPALQHRHPCPQYFPE